MIYNYDKQQNVIRNKKGEDEKMAEKEVKKVFSLRLSPETIAFLHEKSRKTGKTVGEIIRNLIKKTFKKGESR